MSNVFWVDLTRMSFDNSVAHKLGRLLRESGAAAGLSEGMRVALKVNTAEDGYEYGLRPGLVRAVASVAKEVTGALPTVCDGLKLVDYWKGGKGHSFLQVARTKGYSADTLGGGLVINGGFSGDEGNIYSCGRPDSELGGVEVGAAVCRSDALWVFSHVTLHPLFGLAGALWNGGFECLIGRERTRVLDGVDAYSFNGNRPSAASLQALRLRALESHLGVKSSVEGRVTYVNALWDVTPQPEYFPYSEVPVVENLGFLASQDPVSLDAATLSVLEPALSADGRERIRDFHEVLQAAESLGLGSAQPTIQRLS
jgi:uncharacterized Fe-S center protein